MNATNMRRSASIVRITSKDKARGTASPASPTSKSRNAEGGVPGSRGEAGCGRRAPDDEGFLHVLR